LLAYVKVETCHGMSLRNYKEGIGFEVIDNQARMQTLEFKDFYLVNAYLPHSGRELEKLPFKTRS